MGHGHSDGQRAAVADQAGDISLVVRLAQDEEDSALPRPPPGPVAAAARRQGAMPGLWRLAARSRQGLLPAAQLQLEAARRPGPSHPKRRRPINDAEAPGRCQGGVVWGGVVGCCLLSGCCSNAT